MATVTSSLPQGHARHHNVADVLVVVACLLMLTLTAMFLGVMTFTRNLSAGRDFVVYWSTGQQLVHHANPYDVAAMGKLEHAAGFTGEGSFFMRNPPWGLPLALPLGILGPRIAALPWSLLMLAVLLYCVHSLWTLFGRPEPELAWLGFCFPPALQCVIMGQTSIFVLLGLVLFLRLWREHPFWAGAALWFCTLKPHLFLPFALVLLVWIVLGRRYRILLGAVAALAVSCALTWLIDPLAFTQYAHWARTSGVAEEFIPCISVALQRLIDPAARWLAFVPSVLGGLWALFYFWPRRHQWDWLRHGNLVVLVSLLVAPYCWLYDQPLALPAVMFALWQSSSRKVIAALGAIYIVLELQGFWATAGLRSRWYLWPAVTWVVWYLVAVAKPKHVEAASLPPETVLVG
ncbi:MAG: glycosyltransferase family 87 protein [Acidobacteriaceae bacterium]